MKRCVMLICAAALCLVLSLTVGAKEYTYHADEIGEKAAVDGWDGLLESLPEDISALFGDFSLTDSVDSVREKSTASYWLGVIGEMLKTEARTALPDMVSILSLVLIAAIAEAVVPKLSPSVGDAFSFLGNTAVAIPLVASTYRAAQSASVFLTRITWLMNIITPVMEILYISGGNVTEGAVTTTGVAAAVTVFGNLNTLLMTPAVTVLFSLSAVTSICSDVKLGGMTAAVRKLLMRIWQILTLFFSFMIGTQTVIARSADTLSTRTARFAISSMIPVAGGIIAEAYNTLKEGVAYIRTAAGIGGIILILLIFLSGIVPLIVCKAAFSVAGYISEMLGLASVSSLIGSVKSTLDLLIAEVLYSTMMFVFVLVLFAKSREV